MPGAFKLDHLQPLEPILFQFFPKFDFHTGDYQLFISVELILPRDSRILLTKLKESTLRVQTFSPSTFFGNYKKATSAIESDVGDSK